MTQPEHTSLLTTQRVADRLGVSPMRVRQMITEGKLPAPADLGQRGHIWHVCDITAIKVLLAKGRASRPSGLLVDADPPLQRWRDFLVQIPTTTGHSVVHVRTWTGAAADGPRTVILVGQPRGHGGLHNFLSETVRAVQDELARSGLSGVADFLQPIWAVYSPSYPNSPHNVDQLLWIDSEPSPSFDGIVRRTLGRRRAAERDEWFVDHPVYRPSSVAEIERITGCPVEAYPADAYTVDTIQRFERAERRTVDVVVDRYGIGPALEGLRHLAENHPAPTRTGPNTTPETVEHHAARLLAQDIRGRLALADLGSSFDSDGITPPDWRPDLPWPTTWAARLVPLKPAEQDAALIESWPNLLDEPLPAIDTLRPLLAELREQAERCDQFADQPDQQRFTAFTTAREVLARCMWNLDHDFVDHPADTVRVFVVEPAGWDRAYLDTITWSEPADNTRLHRRLLDQLAALCREPDRIRLGRDQDGNAVAHYPGDRGAPRTELLSVQWPLTPPAQPVPPGAQVVSTGGPGDRPAYLVYPGGQLRPLPADPRHASAQWNFGYSGGGPSALAVAVRWLFLLIDVVDEQRFPDRWLDDQIQYSPEGELRVSIDDLRRRYPR